MANIQIIIVGAGISGIATAVLLKHKVPNATLTVYDRLDKIGGTWAANVYPGVRCDVPSHAYQLSFEPNLDWTEYYPRGAEIQQYYENVTAKHGLTEHVHLRHEVLRATWLADAAQWAVEVRDLSSDDKKVTVDTAAFLVNAQGRISDPLWPDIPGLAENEKRVFGGQIVHTARWPSDLDLTGKRVAVIGNGASGQQLVPNIVDQTAHLDHYVRSPTWVTPTFAGDLHEATADAPGGPVYTEEEKKAFHDDPEGYVEYRRQFEIKLLRQRFATGGSGHLKTTESTNKDESPQEALRRQIIECMRQRVGGDETWLKRLVPEYTPGCKRLTPAPGYLETLLRTDRVDYVTDPIERVDATGIVTKDQQHRPVDVIIAATGFDPGFTTRFPVIDVHGVDLRDRWAPNGPLGYPQTYLGIMAPDCPNYFFVLQAQGNARGGTVPLHIEVSAAYIARCIRKIQTESASYVALTPRLDAAEEFNALAYAHFQGQAALDPRCRSWFKQKADSDRLLISWPGTFHHRADALRSPRWEDFAFVRSPAAATNRFAYLGNGTTVHDKTASDEELTSFLRPVGQIDIRTVHDFWPL